MAWALCATLPGAAAQAAWLEARSAHFVVYSDDKPVALRTLAGKLERFDAAFRRLRRMSDDPAARANPVTVYVVPDMSAVRRLCSSGSGKGAKGFCADVAGFYEGRADGSVAFMPRKAGTGGRFELDALTVLFHEYSYHMMLANFSAAYPTWFVEGFAEFNATADFSKPGIVGMGKAPYYRLYGLVNGKPLSLTEMLTVSGATLSGEKREALYGRGWLLTHYLAFAADRQGQLEAYLKAIAGGKSSIDAAKAAFGDLRALDRELDLYLARGRIMYLPLPIPEVPDAAITIRTLTAGEAALMPARLRSDRGVDDAAAAEVAGEARRLAAPFAADAGAQVALAEAEYDAGNDAAAGAAADRALAVRPGDIGAMLYKGRVLVRQAERAGARDAATWQAARRWFVKANRADPDDAAPLLLFYTSFLSQHEPPTANAAIGLARAFDLCPQDEGLRALLAQQYLRERKYAEARTVLVPLAFDPHAAPDNRAAKLVALIDAHDDKGITAMLDRPEDDPAPATAASGG